MHWIFFFHITFFLLKGRYISGDIPAANLATSLKGGNNPVGIFFCQCYCYCCYCCFCFLFLFLFLFFVVFFFFFFCFVFLFSFCWTILKRFDLAGRIAIVPLVQEARGLDAGPRLVDQLNGACDHQSAEIVKKIYEEEVQHVKIGIKWLKFLADQKGIPMNEYFHQLVLQCQ